jgi:hypothetical protein
MTQTLSSLLYTIGSLLIFWAAAVGVASVVVHTRVDWRATAMGRHLMAYMTVIAAILVLSMIRFLFGDSWWFQLIRLAVFVGVPIVMTQRLVLQLRAQRNAAPPSTRERDNA